MLTVLGAGLDSAPGSMTAFAGYRRTFENTVTMARGAINQGMFAVERKAGAEVIKTLVLILCLSHVDKAQHQ